MRRARLESGMSDSTTPLANLRRSPLPRLIVRHRPDLRRRFLLASVFESEPHAFPVMQSLRSVRLGGTPIFTVLRIKKGGGGRGNADTWGILYDGEDDEAVYCHYSHLEIGSPREGTRMDCSVATVILAT